MPGKHNAGGCKCCCNICDFVSYFWRWRICSGAYVDDPDLSSADNAFNSGEIATTYSFMNSIFTGGSGAGTMTAYGPYSRSGTNYEGYQYSRQLQNPGTGNSVPQAYYTYTKSPCTNIFGQTNRRDGITFDDFYFVFGCEWPVGDACHPRWYWGIVIRNTITPSADFCWLCFSEDLGDGPVEATYISPLVFIPPVLPAAPTNKCDTAPSSAWVGYMVGNLYVYTAASGYCTRNPFTVDATLNTAGAVSDSGLTAPSC